MVGGGDKIMIITSDLFHSVNVRIIVLRSCTLIGARNEKTASLITSRCLHENYLGGKVSIEFTRVAFAPPPFAEIA